MTATSVEPPSLHVPDEPTALKEQWYDAVLGGADLQQVLRSDSGLVPWLWARWRTLGVSGVGEAELAGMVDGYRREVWLWLAGERTWAHCCAGLIGRIGRRTTG